VFTARYNATDNGWYSSRINTRDTFNFTYGRFEVRLKTSIAQGMFPAAWLLGYGEWALCGEMDLFEYTKAWESPDGKPQTPFTVHTAARNAANADTRQVLNDPTEFHVYGLEWEEERVVFYLDGEEKFRVERPDVSVRNDTNWPFYRPQYLILNLAIAPDFGRFQDPPADPQVLNGQQYVVDWVRVMQKNRLNETAID
jgi:beta-glucanase (GH16 family)